MDNSAPGGVYLCQINEWVSCGACCGLYNVVDASSEGLTEILIRRTEAFEDISRDVNSILDFKRTIGAVQSRYYTILRELVSSFDSFSELQQAEGILEDLIVGMVSQI